ncbi:MAG: HD domain-containing protein [bacterium]|nr:HD domain-containing protein [bacterium]
MVIPKEVKTIIEGLKKAEYEAYIVGGCVRDFLLGLEPKDWDITTNAKPEEIQKVFSDSFYENNFLTVTVRTGSKKASLSEIEITTYRSEARYSDKRHPDEVKYAKSLQEDLSRRDFTVNAMAMTEVAGKKGKGEKYEIIDSFGGQIDLKKKIIRTVGNPAERFAEDALRMLRAVRFAAVLGFSIEEKTAGAIKKNSMWLGAVSKERVRDEFVKIIMSPNAAQGVEWLREAGLLAFIVPELEENYGVGQNKHHIYDCYQHALKSLEYTAKKKFALHVRLAALFHDIGKPRVKAGEGKESTFYNHEVIGARLAFQILQRLKFSNKEIDQMVNLIRHHMFYYNVDEVSESSVRRLVKKVGPENMEDLLRLREADRIGSGVPKAEPYKLRHLKYVIEKVSKDPISVKMLKVNGKDVMDLLAIEPGPRIGQILDTLLGYVLYDPKKNTKEFLEAEVLKLGKLDDKELSELAQESKEDKTEAQAEEDEAVKGKYWVK